MAEDRISEAWLIESKNVVPKWGSSIRTGLLLVRHTRESIALSPLLS